MSNKFMPVYKIIAGVVDDRNRCIGMNNRNWQAKHEQILFKIETHHLPHGSGFDMGTTIDIEKSTSQKIILYSHYHKMNENGMYDRWIDFRVIVTPNLQFDFDLKFVGNFGRDQDLKEYFYSEFSYRLSELIRR